MPRSVSFNFGHNAKPKKPKGSKGRSGKGSGKGRGNKQNAWRAYTGVSNAPIPD